MPRGETRNPKTGDTEWNHEIKDEHGKHKFPVGTLKHHVGREEQHKIIGDRDFAYGKDRAAAHKKAAEAHAKVQTLKGKELHKDHPLVHAAMKATKKAEAEDHKDHQREMKKGIENHKKMVKAAANPNHPDHETAKRHMANFHDVRKAAKDPSHPFHKGQKDKVELFPHKFGDHLAKIKESLDADPQSMDNRRLSSIARNPNHPMATHAKAELARRRVKKAELSVEGAMKRMVTTQSNKADRMASTDKKGLETYKKKVDEISLDDLKAKISNTGMKSTKKAMGADKLKKDLAAMKAKLATEEKQIVKTETAMNMRNAKLINKIKKSGVAKQGSMKDEDQVYDKKAVAKKGYDEVDEAVGTSAKYAGKSGMFGGKYTSKDRMMDMPLDKLNKIRNKRQAQNKAAHDKQDPKMSKMGYAKHMLDTDKADAKARKRGIDPKGKYDKYKKRNNIKDSVQVDEISGAKLGSYLVKARKDRDYQKDKKWDDHEKGDRKSFDKRHKRSMNREYGMSVANSKLRGDSRVSATESVERVDEVSSNKLSDYMRASSASVSRSDARTQDKRIAGQSMADKKIRKKMGYSSTAKVAAGKNEKANVNEVLDTPQAMQSYRDKNKASKEKAASSAVAKIMRSKDKDNREHPAAELKTMAKRRSGEKMVDKLAGRKTLNLLRKGK